MTTADQELATCLRTWRGRVDPGDAGLPAGGHRRVPGLRREEVAQLAGVSLDYLARLEQGRAHNPSPSVLASLSRALRLGADERSHLYRLAGQVEPGPGTIDRRITPSVDRLVQRLGEIPVLVYAAGEVLTANPAGQALIGDLTGLSRKERHLAWRCFMGSETRVMRTAHEAEENEAMIVADLIDAVARFPDDAFFPALADELAAASPRFAELWEQHPVCRAPARRKTFRHPEIGEFTLDCDSLAIQGTDLSLIVYTAPPGSPDASALQLLATIGLQRLTTT